MAPLCAKCGSKMRPAGTSKTHRSFMCERAKKDWDEAHALMFDELIEKYGDHMETVTVNK